MDAAGDTNLGWWRKLSALSTTASSGEDTDSCELQSIERVSASSCVSTNGSNNLGDASWLSLSWQLYSSSSEEENSWMSAGQLVDACSLLVENGLDGTHAAVAGGRSPAWMAMIRMEILLGLEVANIRC